LNEIKTRYMHTGCEKEYQEHVKKSISAYAGYQKGDQK